MELLLVTAIMAILLGLATPHLGRFLSNQRLSAAAQTLQLEIMYGRAMAIADQKITVICPSNAGEFCDDSSAWQAGWIIFHDLNGDRERQEDEALLRITAALEGIKANSSVHRKRIRFMANGTAVGTAMTISVCPDFSAKSGRSIVIANSGRIRQIRLSENAAVIQCAAWI